MTVTVDAGDGRIIEFPDVETANQFFAQQSPGQTTGEPLRFSSDTLPAQEQSLRDAIFENLIGRGEVDTPGERLGAGLKDVGSELGRGIGRGAMDLLGFIGTPGGSTVPMSQVQENMATAQDFIGISADPKTTAGRIAGTAGEFVPGAVMGGALSPAGIARFGLLPGAASEIAGMATEGTAAEPAARVAAALASPIAAQGASNIARRAISPSAGANPAKLQAAQVLEREGVKVTAGQATGNEAQLFREAATKTGRKLVEDQAEQFTRAVLKRIGVSADRATPEIMTRAADDIGGVFNSVAKGVDVTPTPDLMTKFSGALREYGQLAPKATQAPIVGEINRKIVKAFRGGNPLTSKQVLSWRSSLGKLTKSPDQATREAAISTMNALDDALADSLTALGRADDVARLGVARGQYRNLIAVENALVRAGEQAATGVITPANLRTAVAAQGKRAFAQGRGDLSDLARAGVTTMQPLPQSGTQPRTLARELTSGAQGGTAAGLGSFALGVDPVTAAAIGGAAVVAPRARNALLSSPAGQAFMRNQALQPGASALDRRLLGTLGGLLSQ